MGRVFKVGPGRARPTQDTKLSLRMTKEIEPSEQVECEECAVAVDGLFWQNTETEEFDILSDITEYVEEIPG